MRRLACAPLAPTVPVTRQPPPARDVKEHLRDLPPSPPRHLHCPRESRLAELDLDGLDRPKQEVLVRSYYIGAGGSLVPLVHDTAGMRTLAVLLQTVRALAVNWPGGPGELIDTVTAIDGITFAVPDSVAAPATETDVQDRHTA